MLIMMIMMMVMITMKMMIMMITMMIIYSNNDNNDHGHYNNVTDTALIMSQYIFLLVPDGMVLTSWRRLQLSSPSGGEGKIKHRSRHDSSCIQSGPESLG